MACTGATAGTEGVNVRGMTMETGGATGSAAAGAGAGRAGVLGERRRSLVTFSINRCETPRNVSNTPLPSLATASKLGTFIGLSSAFSSSTV